MTFLQLSYFVAVSEEKSISRAAEKLHIAQPSLSRLINSIESEYNVELFRRAGRTLEMTYAGKLFLDRARLILAEQRNLETIMSDLGHTQQSKLTFGCSTNHIAYLIPPLLKYLSSRFPYLEISVVDDTSSNLFRQLALGRIDILYSHMPAELEYTDELQFIRLAEEELLLVVSPEHRLAGRAAGIEDWRKRVPVRIEEIAGESFIQLRKNHSVRILTDRMFSEHNIRPNIKFEIRSNDVAHRLAAAGLGIAILPESEVRFNRTEPSCVAFPIEDRTYTRQIYISYMKSLYFSAVNAQCIEAATEIAAKLYVNRA